MDARRRQKMRGGNKPADDGLFDTNARKQADIEDEPKFFGLGDAVMFSLRDSGGRPIDRAVVQADARFDERTIDDIEQLRVGLERERRIEEGPDAVVPVGAVLPAELPDAVSLARVAAAFGKRVVGVAIPQADTSPVGHFNGAYLPSNPDAVYIRQDNQHPYMAVLGHELAHGLHREQRALYDQLVAALDPYVNVAGLQAYVDRLARKGYDGEFGPEVVGDIVADGMLDPAFWQALAEGPKGLLVRFVDAVRRLIHRAKVALNRGPKRETEGAFTDFDRVLELARGVMIQYREAQRAAAESGQTSAEDDKGPDLARRGRNQSATPAFRRWFGDSKVVDGAGKPLRVYHATNRDFDAFAEVARQDRGSEAAAGFAFTDSREVANSYTVGKPGADHFGRQFTDGDGKAIADPDAYGFRVLPVYLSLQNPMVVDAGGRSWRNLNGGNNNAGVILNPKFDGSQQTGASGEKMYAPDPRGKVRNRDINNYVEQAKRLGHDGLIVRNVLDAGSEIARDIRAKTYIAFHPEQIKSAIGNRGTFDPANPSILYSKRPDRAGIETQDAAPSDARGDVRAASARKARGWHDEAGGRVRIDDAGAGAPRRWPAGPRVHPRARADKRRPLL